MRRVRRVPREQLKLFDPERAIARFIARAGDCTELTLARDVQGPPSEWCACSERMSAGLPCPPGNCPNARPQLVAHPAPSREELRHVAHCCANHGCAYGADDCPVEACAVRQRSACGAAEPCTREQARPVRPRPRVPLNFTPPSSAGDPRLLHLTGGAKK